MGSGIGKQWGEREVIVKEVSEKQRDVDEVDADSGRTMLHSAVLAGDVDAVHLLISHGASSLRDRHGALPLHYALHHQDPSVQTQLHAALQPHARTLLIDLASTIQSYLTKPTPESENEEKNEENEEEEDKATKDPIEPQKEQVCTSNQSLSTLLCSDARKINWLNDAKETSLLSWLRGLPTAEPPLGYTEEHVEHIEGGFRGVCRSRLERLQNDEKIEGWMLSRCPLDVMLAEYLVGCGCVEYATICEKEDNEVAEPLELTPTPPRGLTPTPPGALHTPTPPVGKRLVPSPPGPLSTSLSSRSPPPSPVPEAEEGGEIQEKRDVHLTDRTLLDNHGCEASVTSLSLAPYSVLSNTMRSVADLPAMKRAEGEEGVLSVFAVTPAPPQLHVVASFAPWIRTLMEITEGRHQLHTLSGSNETPLEGSNIVWNGFVLLKSDDAGNVLLVAKERVMDVGGCLLFAANVEFRVQKVCVEMLRAMGRGDEVVILQEVLEDASGGGNTVTTTAAEQITILKTATARIAPFCTDYLAHYTGARISDSTVSTEDEPTPMIDVWRSWLQKRQNNSQSGIFCLLGERGAGKTAAALSIFSSILTESAPCFPIYTGLATLKRALLEEGGLDRYVQEVLCLRQEDCDALQKAYHIVLILDGLDEAGLTLKEITAISNGGGLLSRHPWVRMHCSVILTVRTAYLKGTDLEPSAVCGVGVHAVYLQPFTEEDARRFVRLQGVEETVGLVMERNPLLLYMACHGGVNGETRCPEGEAYEGYLKEWTKSKMSASLGHTAAAADFIEVEDVLRAGEVLACRMLETNTWHDTVAAATEHLVAQSVSEDLIDVCFRCLPLSIAACSTFTFRHKTLAEYLAARRLFREPKVTLQGLVQRSFTKDAQGVLECFAAVSRVSGDAGKAAKELLELVHLTRKGKDAVTAGSNVASLVAQSRVAVTAGSNAAALMARSRATMCGTDFSKVRIKDCDMRGCLFRGVALSGASFTDCWFEHTEFHTCEMQGTAFPDCTLGTRLPPLHHADMVNAVAVTPDGKHIVSCSDDMTVRMWAIDTGDEVLMLEGHSEVVTGVVITPAGLHVVSSSDDATVRMWCLTSGEETLLLEGHSDAVKGVAVSQDSLYIVSGSDDTTVRIWDVLSGEPTQILEGHSEGVTGVAFTPDSSHTVSCSRDRTIRIWDVSSGEQTAICEGHTDSVTAVAVTPDGNHIASSSDDETVRLWCLNGSEVRVMRGHSHWVTGVVVTPDGASIVSCSDDNTAKVWDLATGRQLKSFEGLANGVTRVAVTPDQSRIVYSSDDDAVRAWEMHAHKEALPCTGHTHWVNSMAVTPDATRIVSCSDDKTLRVWDIATGQELLSLEGHTNCVTGVAVSPNGARVVSCSYDNTARVWDIASGHLIRTLAGHTNSVHGVAVFPDGTRIASCSHDKTVRLWDMKTGEHSLTLTGHTQAVTVVIVSPCGSNVISSSRDETIRVWDALTGRQMLCLEGHTDTIHAVAVSVDGRQVVSCSRDETIRIWEMDTGKELMLIEGHSQAVTGVAMTPDGLQVLSCSWDKTIRAWDLSTGLQAWCLEGHSKSIIGIVLIPDGARAVSCSWDKTVRVWDMSTLKNGGDFSKQRCYLERVLGPSATVPQAFCCCGDTVAPDIAKRIIFDPEEEGDGTDMDE